MNQTPICQRHDFGCTKIIFGNSITPRLGNWQGATLIVAFYFCINPKGEGKTDISCVYLFNLLEAGRMKSKTVDFSTIFIYT